MSRHEVVFLGTAGGPRWWPDRAGIATAIVVGDAWYLVDFGAGVGRQAAAAGLPMERLRASFVTHLHSDHTVDLGGILLYGWYTGLAHQSPLEVVGPGPRGMLPPLFSGARAEPAVAAPEDPTPGVAGMVNKLIQAHATDVNDRMRDNLKPPLHEVLHVSEVSLPRTVDFHPNLRPDADMVPLQVYEDDRIRVSATLVQHAPMAPAFGFRFDTEQTSVVVSGDTGPCRNLVRLARGADLLVHEVIDAEWVQERHEQGRTARQRAMIRHHLSSHTPITNCGQIAREAEVRRLALHHFVPARLERPRWTEAAKHFDGQLVIPEDLDCVPLRPI